MTERIRGHESQIIKGALWLFALIVFFYLRWQPGPETILNIDEYIAPAVSDAMRRLGSLDPNWSNTDLPDFFRYDQYNFYVYMIAAHLAIMTGNLFSFEPVQSARLLNIALQLATIPMLYLSIRNLTGSVICGFAGIFLFITLPTAVMDSAIVRPESLLYFTSAALLLVSTANIGKMKTLVLWGVIFAFGAAIKITFVTLAPLLAGAYILRFGFELKRAAMDAALTVLAFAVALFVLAPFMFINADVTLNGFAYLQNQYDGLHPPHSLKFGNAIDYFLHNLHFFVLVIPAIFVLGGIGLFLRDQDRAHLDCGAAVHLRDIAAVFQHQDGLFRAQLCPCHHTGHRRRCRRGSRAQAQGGAARHPDSAGVRPVRSGQYECGGGARHSPPQ